MSRKTKRQLQKELAQLKDQQATKITVTSSVVTVTEAVVNGDQDIHEMDAPEGYEFGDELRTHNAVTAYTLEAIPASR